MAEETEISAEAYKQALASQSALLKALHADAMAEGASDEQCLTSARKEIESLIALKTKMQASNTAALSTQLAQLQAMEAKAKAALVCSSGDKAA